MGDALPLLEKNLSQLEGFENIGLTATAQHLDQMDGVKEFLEQTGKTIVSESQILGCQRDDALSVMDNVDCYIHLGSGRFHPLILSVESGKPVFILNPVSKVFEKISEEEVEEFGRKRMSRIKRAAGAKIFGIMVSRKNGQEHLEEAVSLKHRIESKGMKAYLLVGDELSPQNLLGVKVDCLVNTACPRIVEDSFEKPVLNPDELEVFLE